ncbi:hypothetical protein [Ferroacidibacillus organovorans]|uniref:hypothetical protein n=1 Tax=Ferroacidibacillus organovorans TaxID=1765683 RepID=UPI001C4E0CDC|nr:hypothetical protein [Ferroacidibacillus organovorans]
MLRPGDGADKAEGETYAAQRLIQDGIRRHGRLADILVFDALYAKALSSMNAWIMDWMR